MVTFRHFRDLLIIFLHMSEANSTDDVSGVFSPHTLLVLMKWDSCCVSRIQQRYLYGKFLPLAL